MAKKNKKKKHPITTGEDGIKVVTRNRKARHLYHISDTYEAGLVLQGTEVKSLRSGRVSMGDSYAKIKENELWLEKCHIDEYEMGNRYNHEPLRSRKLLVHRQEIKKIQIKLNERGYTLVPLSIYFVHGRAKVELGLAKGKKLFDHRQDIKKRDEKRAMARAMKY